MQRTSKPAVRQAKTTRPRLVREGLAASASDRAAYRVPAPGFLLSLWALSLLLLALAVTPRFVLSRVPLDLADRRGGLGFAALAIAALPLFVLIFSAMSHS